MKEVVFKIKENKLIAKDVYRLVLLGDSKDITRPGTFVSLKIDNYYLRRPISVCDVNNNQLTLIYKVMGKGTNALTKMKQKINVLTNLGNGYDLKEAGKVNLLVGGGVGVPPLYYLAKALLKKKKKVIVVLGFNKKEEIFYVNEFKRLGVKVYVTTVDGSVGLKGFVTDAIKQIKFDQLFTCGPMPMLKAIHALKIKHAQYSLEERMGCGFGVCLGCTIQTKLGPSRVCTDGPVYKEEEIIW
ncbi:MAG: dihydroorotate dehydrogenase electron transfer subunit [Bacilli bacterium]|nr:dihydroorotate dehydrogenase electron transfer subunit [Bacilli bacterium]